MSTEREQAGKTPVWVEQEGWELVEDGHEEAKEALLEAANGANRWEVAHEDDRDVAEAARHLGVLVEQVSEAARALDEALLAAGAVPPRWA
jgi:hypothetical protein